MICPHCGNTIQVNYEYCPSCGSKINYDLLCMACKNPIAITQTFCINCGKRITSQKSKNEKKWRLFPVSILLYLTILIFHIIFYLIFNRTSAENMHIISIFDSVMIIAWALFPVYNIKSVLSFNFKIKPKHIGFFIGGILTGFFVSFGVVKLIQYWLDMGDVSFVNKLEQTGYSFTAILLMVCVQPALIEELAFRGIIFRALEKSLKPGETILISAFLFAMLHLSFISLPHLMLLGVFFGYIRYKTGSIWPAVIAHFIHNFSAVLIDKFNLF